METVLKIRERLGPACPDLLYLERHQAFIKGKGPSAVGVGCWKAMTYLDLPLGQGWDAIEPAMNFCVIEILLQRQSVGVRPTVHSLSFGNTPEVT